VGSKDVNVKQLYSNSTYANVDCNQDNQYNYNLIKAGTKALDSRVSLLNTLCIDNNFKVCKSFDGNSKRGIMTVLYQIDNFDGIETDQFFNLSNDESLKLSGMNDDKIAFDEIHSKIYSNLEKNKITDSSIDVLHVNRLHEVYQTKKNLHIKNIERANKAKILLNNARTLKDYNAAYTEWTNASNAFNHNGCLHPLPPIPKRLIKKPKVVNDCHTAYLLGYSIGESLGNLIKAVNGTEHDLDVQNKCVDQYAAYKKLKDEKTSSSGGICFDKGRKEAILKMYDLFGKSKTTWKEYQEKYNSYKQYNLGLGAKKYSADQI